MPLSRCVGRAGCDEVCWCFVGRVRGQVMRKKALLEKEGVKFDETKSVDKGGRITKGCFFDFQKGS